MAVGHRMQGERRRRLLSTLTVVEVYLPSAPPSPRNRFLSPCQRREWRWLAKTLQRLHGPSLHREKTLMIFASPCKVRPQINMEHFWSALRPAPKTPSTLGVADFDLIRPNAACHGPSETRRTSEDIGEAKSTRRLGLLGGDIVGVEGDNEFATESASTPSYLGNTAFLPIMLTICSAPAACHRLCGRPACPSRSAYRRR